MGCKIKLMKMIYMLFIILCTTGGVLNFRNDEELLPFLQPDSVDEYQTSPTLCTRECQESEPPRVCYYQFTLEQYTVMGYACGNCPTNQTACFATECVTADGKERMLLTVNRRLPGPSIQVCKGDTIVVDVENHFLGRSSTIHWHGMRQTGTPFMDGMSLITQCPITASQIFRYKFRAEEAGTFFWHSHDGLQKMDGIIGTLIIRQPRTTDPNTDYFDLDLPSHVMMVNDWMHLPSDDHYPGLLREPKGQEPDSYLINGRGSYMPPVQPAVMGAPLNIFKFPFDFTLTSKTPLSTFTVQKGLRYRFRVIGGSCLSCPFQLFVEGHKLLLIGTDFDSVEPVSVDSVIIAAGEKYDFVIEASNAASVYWIMVKGVSRCSGATGLAYLKYEGATATKPMSAAPTITGLPAGVVLNPRNTDCQTPNPNEVCVTELVSKLPDPDGILKPIPDKRFVLRFGFYQYTVDEEFGNKDYPPYFLPFNTYDNTVPIVAGYINNITLAFPPLPLLTQMDEVPTSVFCSQECAEGSPTICNCVYVMKAPLGSTVEFIIVDDDQGDEIAISHPFHIHGYEFSVMEIGIFGQGDRASQIQALIERLEANPINKENAVKKDTVSVPAFGYLVARVVANNPGVWFMHCHFLYHSETGMSTIFQVGEPSEFPAIPADFPKCHEFLSPNADPL